MVHITRLPTFVFLSVLATCFLASSVESTKMECESLAQSIDPDEIPVTYTVFLKSESNDAHKDWLGRCYGYKMTTSISSDDDKKTAYDLANMKAYVASLPKVLVNVLSEHDEVILVEKDGKMNINYAIPNNLFKRAVREDPQQNLDRIDQAKGTNGKYVFPDTAGEGVNIFVVDTGITIDHSELKGRAKIGKTICGACENDDDENGHGTHVASIAAGKTLGVANKSTVIAVRVLDAKGAGSNVDVVKGLEFVLDEHKKAKNKNTVVNMSLGGTFSAAVNAAVAKLTGDGVHVVVAAGNDAKSACDSSPSSEPTAITVAATDSTTDKITFFSNNGPCVDLSAPGLAIKGADAKNIDNGIVVFSGTSQACPHVAGTVALLISKDGNQSPAAMSKTLTDLSTKDIVKAEDGKANGGKANDLDGAPNRFLRVPAA